MWNGGYLAGVKVNYSYLKANITPTFSGNNITNQEGLPYVEFYGLTDNRHTGASGDPGTRLTAKFTTNEIVSAWARSWQRNSVLTALLAPVLPKDYIGAYGVGITANDGGWNGTTSDPLDNATPNTTPGNRGNSSNGFGEVSSTSGAGRAEIDGVTMLYNGNLYKNPTAWVSNDYMDGSLQDYHYSSYSRSRSGLDIDKNGNDVDIWHRPYPFGYVNENNSGFRTIVTNSKKFAMKEGAKLTVADISANVTMQGSNGAAKYGNLGFHTTHMTISKELLENTTLDSIEVTWVPEGVKYDKLTTQTYKTILQGDELENILATYTKANGDVTIPSEVWSNRKLFPTSIWALANPGKDSDDYRTDTALTEDWSLQNRGKNGNDAVKIEFNFSFVLPGMSGNENFVDLFGYATDSPNVDQIYQDIYYMQHIYSVSKQSITGGYCTNHGCPSHGYYFRGYKSGCGGTQNIPLPTNQFWDLSVRFWRECYFDNFYVHVNANSHFEATYKNSSWSQLGNNQENAGEQMWSNSKAQLLAIAGKPNPSVTAKAYYDATDPGPAKVTANNNGDGITYPMTDKATAYWGGDGYRDASDLDSADSGEFANKDGAGYRFTLANSGRDMWDAELRIGTTDPSHDRNAGHNSANGGGYLNSNSKEAYHNNYWTTPNYNSSGNIVSYTPHWSDPHYSCYGYFDILPSGQKQNGASVYAKLIPGYDDVEDYENVLQGFQTKYVTVNKAMLDAADISGFTFTYVDARGGETITKKQQWVSFDAMARRYGFEAGTGNLVIPYSQWNKGYLTNAVVHIDHYKAGTTADAFVDLYGYVDDVNDLELYGRVIDRVHSPEWRYSTTANPANLLPSTTSQTGGFYPHCGSIIEYRYIYYDYRMNVGATGNKANEDATAGRHYFKGADQWTSGAKATLYARPYPTLPRVSSQSFRRSTGPASEKATESRHLDDFTETALVRNGTTNSYYEEDGSGYRFTLTNNTNFPMRKGIFSTSNIPMFQDDMDKDGKKENVGFETSSIVISKGLFDSTFVNGVTLNYSPNFSTAVKSFTITPQELYAAIEANGGVIYNKAADGTVTGYDKKNYLETLNTYQARIADEQGNTQPAPSMWVPLVEGTDKDAAVARLLQLGYTVTVKHEGTVPQADVDAIYADYLAGTKTVDDVVDAVEALGLQAKLIYEPEWDKDEWYDPANTSFEMVPNTGAIMGWQLEKADTAEGAPIYKGDVVKITVYGDPTDDRYYAPDQEAKVPAAVGTVVSQTPAHGKALRPGTDITLMVKGTHTDPLGLVELEETFTSMDDLTPATPVDPEGGDEGGSAEPTAPAKTLADYVTINADGDIVIDANVWQLYKADWNAADAALGDYDKAYFRGLTMSTRYFNTQNLDKTNNPAYVEFWGEGTYRFVNHSVSGTFRTDWQTSYWNNCQVNYNTNIYGDTEGYSRYNGGNYLDSSFTRLNRNNPRVDWLFSNGAAGTTGNGRITQNSPYQHSSSTTLNVVLPPTRPKVEVYSYINAADYNSDQMANLNGTTSTLPLYRNIDNQVPGVDNLKGHYLNDYASLHAQTGNKTAPNWTSKPRAYLNDEGTGFRVKLTNDSDYNVTHGANLYVNTLTQTVNSGAPNLLGNVGFRTTHLTLSRGILDATVHAVQDTNEDGSPKVDADGKPVMKNVTDLNSVTFYWVPKDQGLGTAIANALPSNVQKSTYNAEDVYSWFTSGTMAAPEADDHTEPSATDDSLVAIAVPSITDAMTKADAQAAFAAAVADRSATKANPDYDATDNPDVPETLEVAPFHVVYNYTTDEAVAAAYEMAHDGATYAQDQVVSVSIEDAAKVAFPEGATNIGTGVAAEDGSYYGDGNGPAIDPDATYVREGATVTVTLWGEDPDAARSDEITSTGAISLDGNDVVLTSAMWMFGDLVGVEVDFGYFKKQIRSTADLDMTVPYIDIYGHTINAPDFNKRQTATENYCSNHGWATGTSGCGGGSPQVYTWDKYYDILQLPAQFNTTYQVDDWNNLYHGSVSNDATAQSRKTTYNPVTHTFTGDKLTDTYYNDSYGTHYRNDRNGYARYDDSNVRYGANEFGERTRTEDNARVFAQVPPAFPAVKARSFFVEEGSAYQNSKDPTYNTDTLAPLSATDGKGTAVQEASTTYSWYRYSNAGFRFHYSNYANAQEQNVFNTLLRPDTNVYDKDYEMYDSYIRLYGMTRQAVPGAEADDYVNDFRGFDASYVSLNQGLLLATTWDKLGVNPKTDMMLGNALTTIQIQAYVPQEQVTLPDFTGMSYAQAASVATALGLTRRRPTTALPMPPKPLTARKTTTPWLLPRATWPPSSWRTAPLPPPVPACAPAALSNW